MALHAAAHMILVTPTGDNSERERGRLIIAGDAQDVKIYRGVVESIGKHVAEVEDIEIGFVAHYSGFAPLDEKHLVGIQSLLAYEDNA